MVQARGHQRMVPFHRALELLAEDGRPRLPGRLHRHEPLGGDEAQLVAIGLVDQHLWLRGIQGRTDELHVEEVDPHAPGCVLHRAFVTAFGVLDTTDGREVAVVNREHRIAVLVQVGSHLLELRRQRRLGGRLRGQRGIRDGEQRDDCNEQPNIGGGQAIQGSRAHGALPSGECPWGKPVECMG